jgi:hypothetical protein
MMTMIPHRFPLWLAYLYRRKQYALARQVAGVESLADLLCIPEAAAAFGQFCAREFTYDSFSFYMRATQFRKHYMDIVDNIASSPSFGSQQAPRVSVDINMPKAAAMAPLSSSQRHVAINMEKAKSEQTLPVVAALRNAYSINELFIVAGR